MAKKEPKYLSPQLIKDLGLLQAINQRVLHPAGFALALSETTLENGTKKVAGIAGVQDYRGTKGGLIFDENLMSAQKEKTFDAFVAKNSLLRLKRFGYVIQQVPDPKLKK